MGDYISADLIPGHVLSGSGVSIPKGSNQGFYPQSGSDAWQYISLPTSDPQVSGSLWVSGSSDGADISKYLMVSQG